MVRTPASPTLEMRPVTSVSPDWYFRGVSPKCAQTASEERNRAGWSTAATKVSATMTPTPGAVISRRARSSSRAWSRRRVSRQSLILPCHLVSLSGAWLEAAWAARQGSDQADGEALADGADRVWDVAFRPDRRPRAAGSPWVAQVPRAARGR